MMELRIDEIRTDLERLNLDAPAPQGCQTAERYGRFADAAVGSSNNERGERARTAFHIRQE